MSRDYSHSLTSSISKSLNNEIASFLDSETGREIIQLPQIVNNALRKSFPSSSSFLKLLSLANLYGWIAYTIYDDFLDGEGIEQKLPTANIALRRSLTCFSEVMEDNDVFQKLISEIFDTIDAANYWEIQNCRATVSKGNIKFEQLPNYYNLEKLADRSLGHALPALAIVLKRTNSIHNKDVENLKLALKDYLIVRQLNDDLHDWQEDLKRGQLTYVNTIILKDLGINMGSYKLSSLVNRMQKMLWDHSINTLLKLMQDKITSGYELLANTTCLTNENPISQIFEQQENIIRNTLDQQSSAQRFMKAYKTG